MAKSFEMIGCGVTFVARKAVLRVDRIPPFHAGVAMCFSEDGSSGDGNTPRVAFDEGLLLDENIELHGVDQQIVRLDGELLQSGGHGLAAGLIDIPGVDALGIDFRDGPGERMLVDACGKFHAALGGKFL